MYSVKLHESTHLSDFISSIKNGLIEEIKSLDGKKASTLKVRKKDYLKNTRLDH